MIVSLGVAAGRDDVLVAQALRHRVVMKSSLIQVFLATAMAIGFSGCGLDEGDETGDTDAIEEAPPQELRNNDPCIVCIEQVTPNYWVITHCTNICTGQSHTFYRRL